MAAAAEEEPGAKRQKLSANGITEEPAWVAEWAEVFSQMQENDMEGRAGEYAEAVLALKKNAESIERERATIKASCDQLLHAAYREAIQSHLKAMLETASKGCGPEIAQAALKTVNELMPPVQSSGKGWNPAPSSKSAPSVNLGIGLPQPGVVVPPPKSGMPGIKARPTSAPASLNETQLVVSGLPEGIDETMFRTLFLRYGSITSVKLLAEQKSGYVKYGSRAEAEAAIAALNGFESHGVVLSVRFADAAGPSVLVGSKGKAAAPAPAR
jgi:hypothetical protein